jgi:hypothetical protein
LRGMEVAACQPHPPVAATRRWWLLPLVWAGVLGCFLLSPWALYQ